MKALLVKVGESPEEISIRKNKNGSIYDKLTELVDGYLECVDIYTESGSETTIICDEEAKLKHKPLNRKLTPDMGECITTAVFLDMSKNGNIKNKVSEAVDYLNNTINPSRMVAVYYWDEVYYIIDYYYVG